jgi:hypothetical protein
MPELALKVSVVPEPVSVAVEPTSRENVNVLPARFKVAASNSRFSKGSSHRRRRRSDLKWLGLGDGSKLKRRSHNRMALKKSRGMSLLPGSGIILWPHNGTRFDGKKLPERLMIPHFSGK